MGKSNSLPYCPEFHIAEIYLLCSSPGLQNENTPKLNLQLKSGGWGGGEVFWLSIWFYGSNFPAEL